MNIDKALNDAQQMIDAIDATKKRFGGYAFPVPDTCGSDNGATWLDVCAWHAMQGLLIDDREYWENEGYRECAQRAYRVANMMLEEKRRLEERGAS